ncbi:MAG: D-aminoacyl-tRNA deacylase, partial [Verrucomicrobia bacterium]|nr:D-aminoacyl-tRNA deacylase [Verrucomicrobiota bacterium]
MRAVIQRVAKAKVTVEDEIVGKIDAGLLVLLGIQHSDSDKETKWLVDKIVNLRIFADDDGKMNLSVKDLGLGLLVISQFTLYGNC